MVTDNSLDPGRFDLAERLAAVRADICIAAQQAGRQPSAVSLIGVSKLFPADLARQAVLCGLSDLGENRVQELLDKRGQLADIGLMPRWHLIGTLQRNKVRQIVGCAHLIHSVDSLDLLNEISRRSEQLGILTDLLLQVNVSGEASKHGFAPDSAAAAAERAAVLPGIRVCGLMTMAPLTDRPDDTLPVFDAARRLFEDLADRLGRPPSFAALSMGMSQDFRQAIRCGATHVRIGSAIFGPRPAQPESPPAPKPD